MRNSFQKHLFLWYFFLSTFSVFSQDLISDIEEEPQVERVSSSFKNSRVINAQSLETVHKGVLDFRISHRFGRINGGAYELFGLDQAGMRMSFEYGIMPRLAISVGRTGYEKTYDGSIKYRLLWQTQSSNKMPLSVLWYSSMSYSTFRFDNTLFEYTPDMRINYLHQMIIGRKFSDAFTLEILPTIVHRNFVQTRAEKNTVYGGAIAGRIRLSRRVSLNAEYFYILPNQLDARYTNSLSVGFDIETGGHVFQLHFTNSMSMLDKAFITETTGDWLNGDIHFGFNISRVFTIKKPKIE
ncbi:MAG: DUF5777 family beta-barrel protein [Bacteroidia bacterium]